MAQGKDSKVPEIRFRGFSEKWTTKRVDEIAPLQRGFDLPTTVVKDGVHPVVYSNGILRCHNEYKCTGPGVVTGRSGTIGKVTYVSENYWPHNTALWVTNFFENNPLYVYYFYTQFKLDRFNAGSTIPTLNRNDVHAIKESTPCPEEQIQIGAYFKELDRLIGLHQRKHGKLVMLKQAMLQKMFPQNGATTPEFRFKGFSGDWVEKVLLDDVQRVVDFRGRTPKKLGFDWSPSGYLALSALNVKNGYIDFSVEAHFGNEELYKTWMSDSELHKNQVLFTTEAPMGNVAQIPDDGKYILSQRTIAFEVKKSLSEDFLAVLLRSPLMVRKLSALSSGGTAKGVSQRSLSSVTSSFPIDVEEQQKIGTYFRQLDSLISKHATQLEKLKQLKSACLEKMFV